MNDSIFIQQLTVDTTIGVYEWEKEIKQPLVLDINLLTDTRLAAQTDNINHALDYFKIAEQVTEFIKAHQFELVETVAEQVANLILTQFSVETVTIKVAKPKAVSNAASVGVNITRRAHSSRSRQHEI